MRVVPAVVAERAAKVDWAAVAGLAQVAEAAAPEAAVALAKAAVAPAAEVQAVEERVERV